MAWVGEDRSASNELISNELVHEAYSMYAVPNFGWKGLDRPIDFPFGVARWPNDLKFDFVVDLSDNLEGLN
ncbi:MAG TPA: hypothetical protein DCQ67_08030 [Acidimicrobiaceae bacterium]|nr:hypothetical protein [Acidimicrobiaceae bacterium]